MPQETTSDTVALHTTAASKKATSCLITTVAQSHSLLFLLTPLHVAPSIAFSVNAAIEHGVYFGITYADLIADVQVRRQTIPNAKRR
ncbi:hypothetical protein Peur_002169 [Populus x canadensis]